MAYFKRLSRRGISYVVIVPLLLNLPILCGFFKADPMLLYSGIATGTKPGLLAGLPLIDPSMGFTHETGGRLAIIDLLHGRLPWWNPFEGTGLPLAGEMQSAAFFFLTPLIFLPNGQAIENLLIELISGVSLFLLLRRLQFSEFAAAVGGILFSLNGSFAWIGAEQFYAAAFLPPLLLGIEQIRENTLSPRVAGWSWVAVPIALSLTTGFPETAYLDALLGVAWALVRAFSLNAQQRVRFLANLVVSAILGVLLVSPLLISFFDYLNVSSVGGHSGAFADVTLPNEALTQTFLPYIWGPIFKFGGSLPATRGVFLSWGSIGGYLGVAGVLLSSIAIQGVRLRPIRVLCFIWAAVLIAASFGVPLVHWVVVHLPAIKYVAFFRYAPASWELCSAILIAFCVDDLVSGTSYNRGFALSWIALFSSAMLVNLTSLHDVFSALETFDGYAAWRNFAIFMCIAGVALVTLAILLSKPEKLAYILSAIAIAESAIFLAVPIMANLTAGSLDMGGIRFLSSNLGLQRFYTLGPIQPNYGAYFNLAEINYNDAPISASLYTFVKSKLDPYIDPLLFVGDTEPLPGDPSRLEVFKEHVRDYAAAGVRYLVSSPAGEFRTLTYGETTGAATPISFSTTTAPVVASITHNSAVGMVTAVRVFQATYSGSANGQLHLTLCSAAVCSSGHRNLSESLDNAYFEIKLDKPILLLDGALRLRISSDGTRPEAAWAFPGSSAPSMTLTQGSRVFTSSHLSFVLVLGSRSETLPTADTGNIPLMLKPGESADVDLADRVPAGTLMSLGFVQGNYNYTADGVMNIRACSRSSCVTGRRSLRESTDNVYFSIRLDRPLVVRNGDLHVRISNLFAHRPTALWLFPNVIANRQSIRSGHDVFDDRALKFSLEYRSDDSLRDVYDDSIMSIYEIAGARPYLSADGCRVDSSDRENARVDCSRPSNLFRLETFMPGWSATVNGVPTQIEDAESLFQKIRLSKGQSTVAFAFEPPYVRYGYLFMVLALVVLIGSEIVATRLRVRQDIATGAVTGVSS